MKQCTIDLFHVSVGCLSIIAVNLSKASRQCKNRGFLLSCVKDSCARNACSCEEGVEMFLAKSNPISPCIRTVGSIINFSSSNKSLSVNVDALCGCIPADAEVYPWFFFVMTIASFEDWMDVPVISMCFTPACRARKMTESRSFENALLVRLAPISRIEYSPGK